MNFKKEILNYYRWLKIYLNRNIRYLDICPSWKCNLKCKFCGAWKRKAGILSIKQIDQIVKEFNKINYLVIEGGEPFLYPNLHYLVDSFLNKTKTKIAIITNGCAIKKISDFTKIYENAKKRIVFEVSINSANPKQNDYIRGNGTFEISLKSSQIIRAAGFGLTFSCTPFFDTINEYYEFIEFAKKYGAAIDLCFLSLAAKFGENDIVNQEKLDFIYKEIMTRNIDYYKGKTKKVREYIVNNAVNKRLMPCNAGKDMFHIDPNGTIRACHLEEDYILGEITEKQVIWGDKQTRKKILSNIPSKCMYKTGTLCNGCYISFTKKYGKR